MPIESTATTAGVGAVHPETINLLRWDEMAAALDAPVGDGLLTVSESEPRGFDRHGSPSALPGLESPSAGAQISHLLLPVIDGMSRLQ